MTTTIANRELKFIQSRARRSLEDEDHGAALIWVEQLLNLLGHETEAEQKESAKGILISVIGGSVRQLIESTMKSTNRGRWQMSQIENLLAAVNALVELDPKNASHRILLAESRLLERSMSKNPEDRFYTSPEDLSEFLNTLWDISMRVNRLAGAEQAEILPPQKRVELSATALENARYMLRWIFAGALSDWKKAQVVCEQVKARLLPGLEIYHVKAATDSIDEAIKALKAQNYSQAHKHIDAAHRTMRDYTWQH